MRHFLEVDELNPEELEVILDKSEKSDLPRLLDGRGMAILFEKPSTRTRNAMEMAVVQLGGHPVYIRPEEIGLDKRESVEDIVRTLSCYHAMVGARVYSHETVERMASVDAVPIVNLLSDLAHPMQAIGDVLTMRQELSVLEGRTVTFVGEGNNVARSLAIACALSGMSFRLASPPGFEFSATDIDRIERAGGAVEHFESPTDAVDMADVVYTDTWASMGHEHEAKQRAVAFAGYQVDEAVMAAAGEKAIFLHCLPAKRGQEVSNPVLDGPQSRVWAQAANRMHSARGVLAWLCEENS